MSVFHKNDNIHTDNSDGIWLDYSDQHWLFFIKDSYWDPEELARIRKAEVTVSFIQKGIVDAFLLEIYDCLETSDIPFCVKEADQVLLDSFSKKEDYFCEICVLDENNKVLEDREIILNKKNSSLLKERLLNRLKEDYDTDGFEHAYQKLVQMYEPFELEAYSLFTQKDRG